MITCRPGMLPSIAKCLVPLAIALLALAKVAAQDIKPMNDEAILAKFAPMELLFCFQGKGSCLPYDAGVLHEAFSRIPALREGRTIVAGNSSGSISAVFFSCFGINEATVKLAEEKLKHGNRDSVRNMEDVNKKTAKLMRGKATEISHDELREYVAFALGVERWQDAATIDEIVRRSSAKPVFPCLIVACNKEVLEDRHPEDRSEAGRLKELDPSNMQVSWKPEVYEYYRQHPDRFRNDHPNLTLGSDRRIGHCMTFFVDQSMFDLLSRIPPAERLADLRLMKNAADMALAIKASVSEPTYFDPVPDLHPEKILSEGAMGALGCSRNRTYYGGYITALPAQDVRRMLPGIRIFGTGWMHIPLTGRLLLKNWMLADCEEIAIRNQWWADMETNPDLEFESHMLYRDLTGVEEADFGLRRAKECFDLDQSLPLFVHPPQFNYPAAAAIAPAKDQPDMYTGQLAPNGQPILKTMRGLGPLFSSQKSVP
jgi:hypothetical protein